MALSRFLMQPVSFTYVPLSTVHQRRLQLRGCAQSIWWFSSCWDGYPNVLDLSIFEE